MAKCQHTGCRANSMRDSQYCYWHNPDTAEQRRQASASGGKGRLKMACSDDTPLTIDDIKMTLSVSIRELQASNADVIGRNRGIGYLASILLTAIQSSDFENRLEALEKKMTT